MQKQYDDRAYFKHYMEHTYLVVLAWKEIQEVLIENKMITKEEFDRINILVIWHDNSKISKEEWAPYAKRFNPVGVQDDQLVKKEFKTAVKHHKEHNFHHFESLKDYEGSDWRCYIIEMICDFIAMGWEFGTYVFEYYDTFKDDIDLPDEYKKYLDEVIQLLKRTTPFVNEELKEERKAYLVFK